MTTPAAGQLRPSTPAIRLSAVIERLGAVLGPGAASRHGAEDDVSITGITHDSRSVVPGDLYAALAGAHHHGADFIPQAVAAGAIAILTDEAGAARAQAAGVPTVVVADVRACLGAAASVVYGDPSHDLTVLGITGTNGKTTTAYLLEAGMRACGRSTGLIGTIATLVDGVAVPSVRTTPEATDLHALLAVMREREIDTVVMEVSSHAVVMGRVDGVVFDVMGFTNLSQDHLDFHPTMQDYFDAKAALFVPERSRRAVVMIGGDNLDDWGRRLVARAEVPVVAVLSAGAASAEGLDAADGVVTQGEPVVGEAGSAPLQAVDVVDGAAAATVRTALTGSWNLQNAVLAAVMAYEGGAALDQAVEGIASVTSVAGRLERVAAANGEFAVRGFVDYAHTPDAVDAVLAELRATASPGTSLVAVVGCGGDRDRTKRPLMGAAAARHADFVIVTDDNPRSEDAASIREAVLAGARTAGSQASIMDVGDRRRAIEAAVTLARPDGVVAVLGKGHETGQEVAGVITPFDDHQVLQETLDAAAAR